jgi:hypothetical protein
MYNNIIYKLFLDLLNVNAKSLNTLMPVIRPLSPKEEDDSLNKTAYKDLLNKAIKALRY